jgi:2-iminobutanoate/2-iminopropanoate deaminase
MDLRHSLRLLLPLALIAAAGCENTPTTKMGVPWWPQGPGNPPASEQTPSTAAPSEQTPTTVARNEQTPATAQTKDTRPLPAAERNGAAQATRYGDLLFLSGQIAADAQSSTPTEGTIEQQTHAVMKKIDAILASHGLTMRNIVQVTVYLANVNDLNAMDAAYAKYFRSTLPARTVVEVSRLQRAALVEIAVVAGR